MAYKVEESKLMEVNEPDFSGTYTAADYISWKFDEMVELVQGKIYKMTAPVTNHQRIVRRLSSLIDNALQGHKCELWVSPTDVYFVQKGEDHRIAKNVFQPDLCIVCDSAQVKSFGIVGVPDFIIEILSTGTEKKDTTDKFQVYEKFGVKEYWIVSAAEKFIIVNILNENGKYRTLAPQAVGNLSPQQFPEIKVELETLFEGLLE